LALGLLDMGLAHGEHVAVIARNRPALYWAFVAMQSAGGISVPLYQDAAGAEIACALDQCGAVFAFCGDQEQVGKVQDVQDRLPGLRKYDHATPISCAEVQAQGRAQTGD